MPYELWDSETQNRVGTYQSEVAGFAAVLEEVECYGPDSPAVLSLVLVRAEPAVAEDGFIAAGDKLVALAQARLSAAKLDRTG